MQVTQPSDFGVEENRRHLCEMKLKSGERMDITVVLWNEGEQQKHK